MCLYINILRNVKIHDMVTQVDIMEIDTIANTVTWM